MSITTDIKALSSFASEFRERIQSACPDGWLAAYHEDEKSPSVFIFRAGQSRDLQGGKYYGLMFTLNGMTWERSEVGISRGNPEFMKHLEVWEMVFSA